MPPFVDITGKKYSLLLVIKRVPNPGRKSARWLCLCDCGEYHTAQTGCLNAGKVRSCGCLEKERIAEFGKRATKHGMSRHPLNWVYTDMLKRCYDPVNAENFEDYGGKGVVVCDEWLDDRAKFFDWAMSSGYRRGLWIDRIAGGSSPYTPSNCRWLTPTESNRNLSSNVKLTLRGVTKTAPEWAEHIGIKHATILSRVKRGWSDEESLLIPFAGKGNKRRDYAGTVTAT